jgi:signal transduction histidine kinase
LGGEATPEVRDYLQRIRISSERMDALVLDALNYNRAVLENLPLEPVDLRELVEGIIRTYPDFQPPKARVWVENALPIVLGNKAGLTQVFSNLLGNAVKFVAPGIYPEVRIRSESSEATSSLLNGAPRHGLPAPATRVWIEDNGIGIPKEWQHRIFDMFQRVQAGYEGTGIGLAIVRKMAERMGGRVGVESEPGKGSRFWLELPPSGLPEASHALERSGTYAPGSQEPFA